MSSDFAASLRETYDKLYDAYGPQHWWPGDTPWEICVGAVLTQNTNWSNVEKAIANLKSAGLMTDDTESSTSAPAKLALTPVPVVAELIRPSGYFNLKTRRLLNVARWWQDYVGADGVPLPSSGGLRELRGNLLSVNGVGPETADSILLYCFNLPTFVVDTYTKRVFSRHLGTPADIEYEHLRSMVMDNLEPDATLFNEFHALIVRTAKESCLKSKCALYCPLRDAMIPKPRSAL